ncbi:hypothetical protein DPMN_035759 [Dreissena polymorpha]|uniref:Uncharacterized protein n=1 Tax=Dreissena polymorpha TaxID=45954 RepID=A0A9D4MAA1_DREPO|nr:hypothetical protein DPMN_035759 [Dreissena polymorpha]
MSLTSGGAASTMRSQLPKASFLLTSECVSWRHLPTSSTGDSRTPEKSLSSRLRANFYVLAANAYLFLVRSLAFLLVFSAFRRDFNWV